jgi:hypothetical protein
MAVICGSIARSFGQNRVWQLSMMAGAMAEPSMSDSDCVAKMTLAFFLRSVFSHSRSWPAKPSSSSASQPSSTMRGRRSVEPVLDAVEEIGEHGGRGVGADQPSVSNAWTVAVPRCSARRRAAAHRARRRNRAQRLLQVVGLEQDARPVMVRSSTGAEASEVSAVQRCSFTSGVMATPSRADRADPVGGPGALGGVVDAGERLQRYAVGPSVRPPPRSCQSPRMASAAARIEPPKSKAKTCAPA